MNIYGVRVIEEKDVECHECRAPLDTERELTLFAILGTEEHVLCDRCARNPGGKHPLDPGWSDRAGDAFTALSKKVMEPLALLRSLKEARNWLFPAKQ